MIFDLSESDLGSGPVLDCPAGASSFTAEAHKKGLDITACDILYNLSADELLKRCRNDMQHVFERFDEAAHLYVWNYYKNKNDVMELRDRAIEMFIDDFSDKKQLKRYIHAELPHLPFEDGAFSLVLSGHFLFLYGDRLDIEFHKACLRELVRISCGEVRIYPLQGLDAKPYPFMADILNFLRREGIKTEIVEVPFEFQRGSNKMMKLQKGQG